MTDTSKETVERLADELPETNWGAPRLYRAADTFRALLAEREALTAEVARLTAARVVLIASDRGVCIGGRWDGWLMVRHPDGHWVSHHKLETVDPATEMSDLLRAAHAARREGGV